MFPGLARIILWWLISSAEFCQWTESKIIVQSTVCTPEDITKKLQCFRETPQEKYEAVVNETIVMRCIVENQHGRVQWRAKEVTMGFDRAIPAMPRFRITGDASRSEYFLTIYPIQLSDNGDYECQVEPIKHHPLLRRRTRLFVYRKPSFPYIIYKSQNVSNSNLLIDPQENCVFLECFSQYGSPSPSYLWMINNKYINKFECNDNQSKSSKLDQRSPSQFLINTSLLQDQQSIECIISNRALMLDSEQPSLRTFVQINFQKRPGLPKTPNEQITVNDGESLRIPCSITPQGLPRAELSWKWSNDSLLKVSSVFSNLNQYSIITIENNRIINILSLPIISNEMHASSLHCQSVYLNHSVNRISVILLVNFIPKRLEIFLTDGPLMASSDQKDFSIYPIKEGEIYFFKCKTSEYYGNFTLSWEYQENYHSSILKDSNYLKENKYFLTQTSSIEIKANRTMHSSILICFIDDKDKLAASIHLEVLYFPKIVNISSSIVKQYLTIGEIIEVNCTVEDGNPIPDLSMYLDGNLIAKSKFSLKKISVKIVILRKHDQSRIYCQAHSQHFQYMTVQSKFLNLSIALLPRNVFMKYLNPKNGIVESGQRQIVSCTAIGSNPEPTISWKLKLCKSLKKQFSEIEENCQFQDIKSVYSNFSFINHKESQLTSILTWHPTSLHHKSTLICKVYNYHFPENIIQQNLEINVVFKPEFLFNHEEKKLKIIKGENATFIIEVKANPEDTLICGNDSVTIELWKRVKPFYSKWIFSIVSANDLHQGKFPLIASNKVGSSIHVIQIDIVPSHNYVQQETIHVSLSTISNIVTCLSPSDMDNSNVTFVWSIRTEDINTNQRILECNRGLYYVNGTTRYLKMFVKCKKEKFANLVFYYISHDDNGKYVCNVSIDGQLMASTIYMLSILLRPAIVKYHSIRKFGCDQFSNCTVFCLFNTVGQVEIQWSKTENSSNFLLTTNFTSNTSDISETTLILTNISSDQYGKYNCKVSNTAGSDVWSIEIVEPSSPERPIDCTVKLISTSFANITWKPGFNGGKAQVFK